VLSAYSNESQFVAQYTALVGSEGQWLTSVNASCRRKDLGSSQLAWAWSCQSLVAGMEFIAFDLAAVVAAVMEDKDGVVDYHCDPI